MAQIGWPRVRILDDMCQPVGAWLRSKNQIPDVDYYSYPAGLGSVYYIMAIRDHRLATYVKLTWGGS